MRKTRLKDDLEPEYDLSKLGRPAIGKYARGLVDGGSLVILTPEVAKVFPDSESVNHALRMLIELGVSRPRTAGRTTAAATRRRPAAAGKKPKRKG
jgi:hypothetical protein